MTYEIKNADLFNMFGDRHGSLLRRRSRSIVWPGRAVAVPEIPFKPYDATVRNTFRSADAANKRAEEYLNSHGMGDVLHNPVMPTRRDIRRINRIREKIRREQHDLRPVDSGETWETATTRWSNCENHECKDCNYALRCLDRQWAGKCPAFVRSGVRFDTSGVQSPGRKPA